MSEYVIKINNLVKKYKELTAVNDLSLEVKEGEIFGLLGPNGSGKSTTINCIMSLLKYDGGQIKLFDKEMSTTAYDIKEKIGLVMQDVAVFNELTVYENVNYFCGLYIRDKEKRKKYVEEAISFVGLEDYKKFYPKKLSGGLLRRLNIACGVAHKPKLIFFDEPTVAVDPQSRNKILEGIEQLNKNGATIVYTSHYMEEVEQLCSRIAIIDKGQLIAIGTKEELVDKVKLTEMISVEVKDYDEQIGDKLKQLPHASNYKYEDNKIEISFEGGKHNLIRVMETLKDNNVHYSRVHTKVPTLNDVFLEITGKELRD